VTRIDRQAAANDVSDCAGSSGALLPPSPPAEQATARQDQAGQARDGGPGTLGQRDYGA